MAGRGLSCGGKDGGGPAPLPGVLTRGRASCDIEVWDMVPSLDKGMIQYMAGR